jgi:hypothetical protein
VPNGDLARQAVGADQHKGEAVVFEEHDRALLGMEQLDGGSYHFLDGVG